AGAWTMNERVGSSARLRAAASLLIVMLRLVFLRLLADPAERAQMAIRALLRQRIHHRLTFDKILGELCERLAPMIHQRRPVGGMIGAESHMAGIGRHALTDERAVTPTAILHRAGRQYHVCETTKRLTTRQSIQGQLRPQRAARFRI